MVPHKKYVKKIWAKIFYFWVIIDIQKIMNNTADNFLVSNFRSYVQIAKQNQNSFGIQLIPKKKNLSRCMCWVDWMALKVIICNYVFFIYLSCEIRMSGFSFCMICNNFSSTIIDSWSFNFIFYLIKLTDIWHKWLCLLYRFSILIFSMLSVLSNSWFWCRIFYLPLKSNV